MGGACTTSGVGGDGKTPVGGVWDPGVGLGLGLAASGVTGGETTGGEGEGGGEAGAGAAGETGLEQPIRAMRRAAHQFDLRRR